MKIDDVLKVLNDSNSSYLYEVYVPSLKRTLCFKPMTVGQQKTISKLAMENHGNFSKSLVALMIQLCTEEIDINEINQIDKIIILSHIIQINAIMFDKFEIECSKCKTKFNHELNLIRYCEQLKNTEIQSVPLSVDTFNVKYDCIIAPPSVQKLLLHQDYTDKVKKVLKEDPSNKELLENIDLYFSKYSQTLFIKELKINNEEIDDFSNISFEDLNDIFDSFPKKLIDEINQIINTNFAHVLNNISYKIVCPKCKHEIKEIINLENFFYF